MRTVDVDGEMHYVVHDDPGTPVIGVQRIPRGEAWYYVPRACVTSRTDYPVEAMEVE
jgi:hypothetical protein